MAEDSAARHRTTLQDLNHHFVRSVGEADVGWFDRHLSDDFHNTNPDGTLIERAAFLAQVGHDVKIRVLGDFAIIHARTSYTKPDGSTGGGWYTDDWQLRPEGWRCVSAHVSRS